MKITQLPSGRYSTNIYIGKDTNGKKRFKRFTADTKNKVKQMANEYLATHTSVVDVRSLDDCIQRYLDERKAVLSPSTYNAYLSIQRVLKTQYAPLLRLSVDNIGTSEMQRFVSSLTETDHSPKYIHNILGLIKSSLKADHHVFPDITLPEKEVKDIPFPSEDYIHNLLACAQGKRIEIALRLSTYGLRRGEVCGLFKEDLSQKETDGKLVYIIHIQRSMVQNANKQWEIRIPKTPASNRFIPIDENLAKLILETDFADGRVTDYTPRTYSAAYLRFLKSNNLKYYHIHSYRHFFASFLHDKGYKDAQIMKLGGWSTPHVMNQVYRHAMDTPDVTDLIGNLGEV